MRRNWNVLLAAGVLLVASGVARATILPVPLKPQQTNMWCWAASGQMIMNYLGAVNITQCEQANVELGRGDCCNMPTPSACVQGGYTQFDKFNFNVQYANGALSFAGLQSEINANRPVEFAWSWTGGGGHVMVAVGYTTDRYGTQYVYDQNPWPPNQGVNHELLTYSRYVSDTDHTHQNDAYMIQDNHLCYADFNDLPAGSFQGCFNYWADRGRWPATLTAYQNGGTVMAGSFQPGASRPVRTFMTPAQFNSYFSTYASQGWRPDQVSVLETGSGPLFTAIWTPANDGPFQTYFGMTDASFNATFSSLGNQGYIITDLFGYQDGGSSRYVATWVKKANNGYITYTNMTAAQYNSNFSSFLNQGWQPVRFSAYPGPNGTLYSAIWLPLSNAMYMYYNMDSSSYQSIYNSMSAQGFRLKDISGLNGLLGAIWVK